MLNKKLKFYLPLIFLAYSNLFAQPGADSLLSFLQQNKSRASVYLQKNGVAIAKLTEDKLMPLASTVKILVAVEFAKQAAANVFNENLYVDLRQLEKYYLPNTDGDAHPAWLNYEKQQGHINNDRVKLIDVARGMIMFSSNANTEFLMDFLGFENVNSNIQLFGLKKHTRIYPLVSSLFIYQNPQNFPEKRLLKQIRKVDDKEYEKQILLIHDQLKNSVTYKQKFRPQDLTLAMQKLWSDRLPASTTKEYVQLCTILNNRKFLGAKTYEILAKILETLMENPANQQWLLHAGMKGGSTLFVLTKALYATLKDGTKIEFAYFLNNLNGDENYRLQKMMNDFELKVLSDDGFRKKVVF